MAVALDRAYQATSRFITSENTRVAVCTGIITAVGLSALTLLTPALSGWQVSVLCAISLCTASANADWGHTLLVGSMMSGIMASVSALSTSGQNFFELLGIFGRNCSIFDTEASSVGLYGAFSLANALEDQDTSHAATRFVSASLIHMIVGYDSLALLVHFVASVAIGQIASTLFALFRLDEHHRALIGENYQQALLATALAFALSPLPPTVFIALGTLGSMGMAYASRL